MNAPDQANAEVSDERMREIEQAILLLRPAGNIAYNMKHPGAVSPNAGGAAYEFGRINDAVNAAIKLLSSARRSVTSQASEGEVIGYVTVKPGARPETALDLMVLTKLGPGRHSLYASPSKRVERLETATIDEIIEQCAARVERFPLVSKNVPAAIRALKGGAA